MQMVFYVYVLLGALAIMAGCNANNANNAEKKDEQLALIKRTDPDPVTLVSHNKEEEPISDLDKTVESFNEIYDVAAIRGKNETLIVYKVKHMHRFRMKEIEKEINSKLEKRYPDENFVVSSDYKIFLEAVKLGNKMKDPNYSKKKANDELDKIIKLKEKLT
ncbi:sporulation protein [Bacillus benzoevorans]|nr:sporulation protein [Bacillus benzoevorans]